MIDDATQGDWQPLADQPVLPEETAVPRDPNVVWAQPPGGLTGVGPGAPTPKRAEVAPPIGATPPTALPPPNPWPPSAEPAAVGLPGDYMESPPRRRPPVAGLVGLVVIGALILAGLAFAVSSGSKSASTAGAVASESAAPRTAAGPLDGYLLSPDDVGPATQMTLVPDGRSLSGTNGATLDFCDDHFTSEQSRTARVQAQYDGPAGVASNEFVRYRPGSAPAAFAEIKKAVSTCGTGYQNGSGTVSHIQQPIGFTGLAPQHVVVSFAQQVTGQQPARTFWVTCVYQFDGDYFSGVYVYSADQASGQQLAQSLAAKAAGYLKEAASGGPGTGGGIFSNVGPDNAPGLAA